MNRIHPNAQIAAEASEAAGAQGEFWAYHDALFARQSEWSRLGEAEIQDYLINLAEELGLDGAQFTANLQNGTYSAVVAAHEQEAVNLGLAGTPSAIFNGELLTGDTLPPLAYYFWDAFVQLTLLEDRQYDSPPAMTIDPEKSYRARVEMASGDEFVIELLPQSAPQTVNSFVFLAEEGWFDGVTFHRVLPGFVAQTGDPTGTGFGGPGYTIPNEVDPDLSHDEPGVVAMANSGPDTNGSQWYITLGDVSESLDGSYTIFGRVVEGMAVVQELTPRDPNQNPDLPPGDKIDTITIEESE